jgi:DNA-binding NtrC family response regulator
MVAKVLLIDDDIELCSEIEHSLTRRGFNCRTSHTLADAQRALQELQPDVVLTDVKLPDGNGIAFLRQHRRALPLTSWLLMSGDGDAGAGEPVRDLTVFAKPLAWDTLIGFIRDARQDWSR